MPWSELAKFQKEDATESSKLYLAAVLAAELGEGAGKVHLRPWKPRLRNSQRMQRFWAIGAARALSLASKAISRTDKTKGRQLAGIAASNCSRRPSRTRRSILARSTRDADLDAIRDDPAFSEIMKAGHPDRRYTAVWSGDASFEAITIYGVDPASQLQKCLELISQGYRPVSLTLTRARSDGRLATASVWHRPVVSEESKDRLAERQARAAVALVRMGRAEDVWALLRHSADPRVRSFILNWLDPLGCRPEVDRHRIRPSGVSHPPSRRPPRHPEDGGRPVPPRDLNSAGFDPGVGSLWHGGAVTI